MRQLCWKKTIEPSHKILTPSQINLKYITNAITNHQLLIIKTICLKQFRSEFLGHNPLGFVGFNKPPIEVGQLPVETNRVH